MQKIFSNYRFVLQSIQYETEINLLSTESREQEKISRACCSKKKTKVNQVLYGEIVEPVGFLEFYTE